MNKEIKKQRFSQSRVAQGFEYCLQSVRYNGLFVPTYLSGLANYLRL